MTVEVKGEETMPVGTLVTIILFGVAQLIAIALGAVAMVRRLDKTVTVSECTDRHENMTERIHETETWRAAVEVKLKTIYEAVASIRNGGHAHANPHPTNGFPEWPEDPMNEED